MTSDSDKLLQVYSRRKRKRLGQLPDVFTYDTIPEKLRRQISLSLENALDDFITLNARVELYGDVVKVICEEVGRASLSTSRDYKAQYHSWLTIGSNTDEFLDAVELLVWGSSGILGRSSGWQDVLARINGRFFEAGVGYAIEDRQIIQKSNEFAHQEIVRPALHVLSEGRFANANQEFRDAFDAYRNGEYEDCLVDCLKAFESVMKVIADERGWEIKPTATAKDLIAALYEHDFIPSFMQNQFAGLRTMLESSVPTTRNKAGGHGKGTKESQATKELAAFQIHQTAAIIVFLGSLDT